MLCFSYLKVFLLNILEPFGDWKKGCGKHCFIRKSTLLNHVNVSSHKQTGGHTR